MAEILAFVRTTPRSARTVPAADHSSKIVVFPGASVELHALLGNPEDALGAADADGRAEN